MVRSAGHGEMRGPAGGDLPARAHPPQSRIVSGGRATRQHCRVVKFNSSRLSPEQEHSSRKTANGATMERDSRRRSCASGRPIALLPGRLHDPQQPTPRSGLRSRGKWMTMRSAAGPRRRKIIKVHTPDKRDGAVLPAKRASTASTSQDNTLRFCRRQVSTTVSNRSTNLLPADDCVPNDSFRQITA